MTFAGNEVYHRQVTAPMMLFMTFAIILVVSVAVLLAAPRYGVDSRHLDGRRNW
jgi:hypothetical protein